MKKIFKKVLAGVLSAVMILSMGAGKVDIFAGNDGSLPTYTDSKQYTIQQILSDYQFFVKGDLTTSIHDVGAVAIGGTGDLQAFGDGAIINSYIHSISKIGNYNAGTNSHYLKGQEEYSGYINLPVYYHDSDVTLDDYYIQDDREPGFIDFDTAFEQVKAQSKSICSAAKELTESDISVGSVWGASTNILVIPFSDTLKSVKLSSDLLAQIDAIDLSAISNWEDIIHDEYSISIEGCNSAESVYSFGGDQSYLATGDKKIAIIAKSGTDYQPIQDSTGLKSLSESAGKIQGGQMFMSGMKLLWNFPEATTLSFNVLPGHVIAPNANVSIEGGNFEGGIIADTVPACSGEAHFYPYTAVGEAVADVTLPSSSPSEEAVTSEAPLPSEEVVTSEAPASSEEVVTSEAPAPSEEVVTSEAPLPSEEAVTSEAPSTSEVLITSEAPAPSEEAATSEAPAPSEEVVTSEVPAPSEVSVTSEAPAPSKEAVTSEAPSTSEVSVISEAPVSSQAPTASETITTSAAPVMTTSSTNTTAEKGNLDVIVRDKNTNEAIKDATLKITNKDTKDVFYMTTDENGEATKAVACGSYTVEVVKVPEGYTKPDTINVSVTADDKKVNIKAETEQKTTADTVTKDSTTQDTTTEDAMTNTTTSGTVESPKTGERSMLPPFLIVGVLSGGAIIFAKKKKYI